MISKEVFNPFNNRHVVQYSAWSDCCNNCDFCLRKNRKSTSNNDKINSIRRIRENIKNVDWKNKFSYGISILGGELFYIKNKEVQDEFLKLIDDVIEYVLIPGNKNTKFSTVTNGLYDPSFLYKVIDKIVDKVGIGRIDVNFSYDLKYRYSSESSRIKAFNNINNFHKRYDYRVGIQMILTQYVIDLWKAGKFDVNEFLKDFPGCTLSFLYPHEIHTGRKLEDFYFNRDDFLKFLIYLKNSNYEVYFNFINSTKNSSTFKYTGLIDKREDRDSSKDIPILSDGKEEITECGHSVLYRCYSDCDKCIFCDIENVDSEI